MKHEYNGAGKKTTKTKEMAEWGEFSLKVKEHDEESVLKLMEIYNRKFDYDFPLNFYSKYRDPGIPTEFINALRAFEMDFEIYVTQEVEGAEDDVLCHIKCEYENGKENVITNRQIKPYEQKIAYVEMKNLEYTLTTMWG
jgi:hypothetical protein